jgi:hypothetical protein
MKIHNLTGEIKTPLSEQSKKITTALDAILKANHKLARAEKRRADLIADIALLEKSDPDNKDAIRTLGEKRTELSIVERQIAEIPPVDVEAEHQLKAHVRGADNLIAKALAPTLEAYVSGIAEVLKPFCLDAAHAKWVAYQTSASHSLSVRVYTRFGTYGAAVSGARFALQAIDEILTGELNWSFTPKA